MLFSVVATAMPPISALEVSSAPTGGVEENNDPYYRIIFEDGVLRIQLNPQRVYDLLRDGSVSREDLLNFLPENVLDTLSKGSALSIDDLRALVSNYISPSDLKALKDLLPTEVLQEHFDLSMLEDLITVEELLALIPVDDLLNGVDDDAISALITPAALKLLLNDTAKNAVLTDTFVEELLNESNVLDTILADAALREELAGLINGAIVDELLKNARIKEELLSLMESPDVLAGILEDEAAMEALQDFFVTKQDAVSAFLTDAEVIKKIKNLQAIHDSLVTEDVINNLITAEILNKNNVRQIFTDAQLESLISSSVIEKLLTNAAFVNSVLGDNALVDELITDSLLDALLDAGVFEGRISPADVLPSTVDWNAFGTSFGLTVEGAADALSLDLGDLWTKYGQNATINEVITGEGITAAEICDAFDISVSDLIDKGYVSQSDLYDPDVMREVLRESQTARRLVSNELSANEDLSLNSYWNHVDFLVLVNAIGISNIQAFVNDNDEIYEKLLQVLSGSDIAIALGDDLCSEILQNNTSEIIRAVGMAKLFEYFDRNEIVASLGGYYSVIQKGYIAEEDVIDAIGGYTVLLDYLPIETVIEKVGYDRLLEFVSFSDIVASAGGYNAVLSWYTPTELQAILNAIGTDRIKNFLTTSGIIQQIDYRQITSDLLSLLRSKGEKYKEFQQEAVDRFLLFLNTEVASIYINDTEIYYPGHFDFEAIVVSLLQEIPDVNAFLAMKEGDALAQWILRATVRGVEYQLGISIEFIGDFSCLQELASQFADDFRFEVGDDLDIVSKVTIPSVGAEIYKKVLLSSRVSTEFKKKLLIAPTELTLSEFSDLLVELSDEELMPIVETVSEKMDEIRAKTYEKLDATLGDKAAKLAAAKEKADQILDAFTSVEKLKALRDKVLGFINSKIPAELADKTLAELYAGDQSFRFEGPISEEYYDKALTLLQKLGLPKESAVDILVYFGNSLALEGTFDTTAKLNGIYQLTLKDSDEKTHIFYLPAGIDLSIITELFPSLMINIPDGAVMPSEDTTISDPDIWWQVDFYADGVLIESVYYLKDQVTSLDPSEIPMIPEKLGYSGVWSSYVLSEQPITRVDAIYTKITYTTTIKDETLFPEDYEFEVEYSQADRSMELPIPQKIGYTFDTWYIDVNKNGVIDEEDIRLERVVMFRMLRMAPTTAIFTLPDGEVFPAGDNLALIAKMDVIEFEITFVDYLGNVLTDATLGFNLFNYDKAALTALFPSLSLTHYTIEWFVGDTAWSDYVLPTEGENIVVTAKKIPIIYSVIFSAAGQTVLETTYTVENTLLPTVAIPTPPTGYTTDGIWYVVSVDGVALETPVKLSEYTISGGNLEIKAFYTPITYTATFYDKDGNVIATLPFTVEDTEIAGAPSVPARLGYDGVWESYTIVAENLEIHPIYTAITYQVTFKAPDQTDKVFTYTVEDLSLFENLPLVPDRIGYKDGTWYVISVGGVALDAPVKLSEYTVTVGDLVIEARYTIITYTATFYREDGSVLATIPFTVEDEALSEIPNVPAKEHYTGVWEAYTLGAENLEIHPVYTPINYTATFIANGAMHATLTYTVENTTLDLSLILPVPGITDVTWYVISVNGTAITPVKLSEYTVTHGDIVLEARGTYVEYTVSFKVNGMTISTDRYTVVDKDFTVPSIPASFPDRLGYTKEWYVVSVDGVALATPVKLSEYDVTTGDLVIEASYTAIEYTATFKDKAGNTVGEVKFTVNGFLEELPAVPALPGYKDGVWVLPSQLPAANIEVVPNYTIITYTVVFQGKDGFEVHSMTYTVETLPNFASLTLPAIPDLSALGYENDGIWYVGAVDLRSYVITEANLGNLVVTANYTAMEYTAIFKDKAGNTVGEVKFNVNGFLGEIPEIPEMPGYTNIAWNIPSQLPTGNMTVTLTYQLIQYTASYYVDGVLYDTKTFTVEDLTIAGQLPVPQKNGYNARWSNYTIGASNLEINAIYTVIQYNVTFKAPGHPNQYATYSIETPLVVPEVPERIGYTDGAWYVVSVDGVALATPVKLSEYEGTTGNLVIEAKYTAIVYTAFFLNKEGATIAELGFTVEGFLGELPAVPEISGYRNGAWIVPETLPANDLYISPSYETMTYTAIFHVPGATPITLTYSVENPLVIPEVPSAPAGYVGAGEWYILSINGNTLTQAIKLSEYEGTTGDLVIEARYEFVEYTATFRDENQVIVGTAKFTVNGFREELPSIAEKLGFVGEWYVVKVGGVECTPIRLISYHLGANDIDVEVRYFPIVYHITFIQQNGSASDLTYSLIDLSAFLNPPTLNAPLPGYMNDGVWYVTHVNGVPVQKIKFSEYTPSTGNITVEAIFTPIEYTATFRDEDRNVIGSAKFTVEGWLGSIPSIPAKPGYFGTWYVTSIGGITVEPIKLSEYSITPPAGDMEIVPFYTIETYTVTFYKENGSFFHSTTYTIDSKEFTVPDVPTKPGYTGEWYVVVDSNRLVKLSEYEVTTGDLTVKAVYTPINFTAYFRVDGVIIGSTTFNAETKELTGIPPIPAKRGYSASWASYTLGLEDLYIDAIYTLKLYYAVFEAEDQSFVDSVRFTINDTSIKAPPLPKKAGYVGAWYVVAVNETEIEPVLLSEFTLTDANLTVRAIYEAKPGSSTTTTPSTPSDAKTEDDGMSWIWWIIIVLILIALILLLLLVLKKKNLPPFKRAETPPAIIAAAIPEEEEEEEEEEIAEEAPETPVAPIVTVESVDVETADEMMSDETAIAVVETIETETIAAGQKVILNLHVINDNFDANDTVDLDALKAKKLVSAKAGRIKILADGTIDKPLTVIADAFSVQAIKMITLTGGHAVQKKSKR